jgi:catalase
VFDDGAKQRFISNVSGHMKNCHKEEIIKHQVANFPRGQRVSGFQAGEGDKRQGHDGISGLSFNRTPNGMARNQGDGVADRMHSTVSIRRIMVGRRLRACISNIC